MWNVQGRFRHHPLDRARRRDHPPDRQLQNRIRSGERPLRERRSGGPDAPRVEIGTLEPEAGAYSPFTLKIARDDGTQRITGIDTTLPRGLLAKLAGIPYCPDGGPRRRRQEDRQGRAGFAVLPGASRVGGVNVGAGAGPSPFYTDGRRLPGRPLQGRAAQPRGDHPGRRRSLRPRQRGRPAMPSTSTPKPPRSRAVSDPFPRSSRASRSICARSSSTSTGRASPSTRPAATDGGHRLDRRL